MNKKYKRVGIITVLAVLGLGLLRGGGEEDGQSVIMTEVQEGSLKVTVVGYGEIQALENHKLVPQIENQATLNFVVENGVRVKKGEVVVRLNTTDLETRIEDMEFKVADLEIDLSSSESGLDIQRKDNEYGLKTAVQELEAARMGLQKFEEADKPMNIRKAELDLNTTASDLKRKQRRYEDLQQLLTRGFVTEDEVEEGRIALETAEVARETAEIDQQVMRVYLLPEKKLEFSSMVEKAEINVAKIEANNSTRLREKEMKVDQIRHKLEKTREDLKGKQDDLVNHVMIAPVDGVVTYGDPDRRWNDSQLQIGQQVHRGRVLITIPDFSKMKASVKIPESDIDKIAVGNSVNLSVDAVPNKQYVGEVVKVAEVAADGDRWGSGVKEFKVEIAIENDEGLRPGYSCKSEILSIEVLGVLTLPVQSVFKEDGGFFVYAGSIRKSRKKTVTIGLTSMDRVQILEGLKKGEKVRMAPPGDSEGGG